MILNIYLLCQLINMLMVSGNQQIAIPIQTYPVYQQTAFNAQSNVPVLLVPVNNNNPYVQADTAQTVIPNDLASVIVSKVLSSPTVHSYVDPNLNYCNKNAVEYKKPTCHGAIVPHVTNNYFIIPPEYLKLNDSEIATEKIAPKLYKVIENNVVITPEAMKKCSEDRNKRRQDLIDSNKEKLSVKTEQLKGRKERTRKRNENQATITKEKLKRNDDDDNTSNLTKAKRNKGTDTMPEIASSETSTKKENDGNSGNQTKTTRRRSRKRKRTNNNDNNKTEAQKPDNTNTSEIDPIPESKKLVKQTIQKSDTLSKDIKTLEIISNSNSVSGNKRKKNKKDEDNRVTRNSKDDYIIKDFIQKYPEVSESLAQSMLSYVKNQFQNNFGINSYYPEGLPFSYDQFFQLPQLTNFGRIHKNEYKVRGRNRKRKQRHRKRSNKKKRARKNAELVKQSAPLIMDNETTTQISIKENPISEEINEKQEDVNAEIIEDISETLIEMTHSPEKTSENSHEIKESESIELELSLEDLDPNIIVEDYPAPELSEEVIVPTMYDNRIIEDYYPIFTDDAGNFAHDNEYYVNNNDRYYYTTDHHTNTIFYDDVTKPRKSFKDDIPKLLKYTIRDNLPKYTYFDADKEALRKLARELPKSHPLLQPKTDIKPTHKDESFKSPPALEFPDFITKKVEKPALKSEEYRNDRFDDVAEKSILNSKYFPGMKPNGANKRKSQESPKDIETVYAKSKVVKYGADENYGNGYKYSGHETDDLKNEHLSYVIAKSLIYPN